MSERAKSKRRTKEQPSLRRALFNCPHGRSRASVHLTSTTNVAAGPCLDLDETLLFGSARAHVDLAPSCQNLVPHPATADLFCPYPTASLAHQRGNENEDDDDNTYQSQRTDFLSGGKIFEDVAGRKTEFLDRESAAFHTKASKRCRIPLRAWLLPPACSARPRNNASARIYSTKRL